ncbi:transketolase [Candidatus Uhrbacteria bacterium]|nr:transketolase [Candidatus Uhrbacteria bacterium]
MIIHATKVARLEKMANTIRQDIMKMLLKAGSGHSAGPLGMADVFTALYFHVLHHKPKKPSWDQRDRLILSCGHICPVRYAAMARAGYFPLKTLSTLRNLGSLLQGHPELHRLPAIENTSGPLAQGTSVAVGSALAGKMDGKKWRVYGILSDGEHQEGQTWEAIMFAGNKKLHNLTFIVDRNNIQIDGMTEDIMPLEPFADKYRAFNWHVIEIDGHNIREIIDACEQAKRIYEKPTVIIAHTIPGRGVDFMEKKYEWHGIPPNKKQADLALHELRTLRGKIVSEQE